jgi:hypothetical protein
MNDDERLKQTFDKLRQEDARGAPSFDAVRSRRARRRSPWAVVVPIGSLLAAAAVIVVWCNAPSTYPQATAPVAVITPPLGGELAPPVDEAPLDFLLDLPALRGAPDFDTSLLRGSLR